MVQSTSRISAGQVGALVGAHEAQPAAGDAEELLDRGLELLGLVLEVAAVDVEDRVAPDVGRDAGDGVDQHADALERVELAEDRRSGCAGRRARSRAGGAGSPPSRPFSIITSLARGRPHSAKRPSRKREGETKASTSARKLFRKSSRRIRLAGPISGKQTPHSEGEALEQSAPERALIIWPWLCADHQVLVQREDDRHVAERAAGGADRLHAEAHGVVEVDHVGPAVGEEALEMAGQAADVASSPR